MSAARRAARAGRNLLIALLLGAVIIVAIVIAYVVGRSNGSSTAAPTSAPASTSQPSVESSGTVTDVAPTGCLGGADRDNRMLLAAQKSAQHSTYGAAEVATAFYRWSYRYPVPTADDVKGIGRVFVPSDSAKSETSLIAGYVQNPNPAAGTVASGTPFYLSTVGGRWISQAGSASGTELISIQTPYVINGAVSATKTATAAFNMRWLDGAWRVASLAKGDPAKVAAGGTAFTAGC